CCFASAAPASAAPGHVDRSFNATLRTNESVFSLAAQNDGKLIVGTSTGGVFRVNLDGSRDDSFTVAPLIINPVYIVAMTVDGQVLLNGISRANGTRTIARLNS